MRTWDCPKCETEVEFEPFDTKPVLCPKCAAKLRTAHECCYDPETHEEDCYDYLELDE